MQLKLRHLINSEILIYPGYVPDPGVKYRVFHYGLEFIIGNWSFDKAKWRNVDVVNRCWAKFPDPPDPSMLNWTDDNLRQKDLLSIECIRTLNEALQLHHKRRNCSDPSSISTTHHDKTTEAARSISTSQHNKTKEAASFISTSHQDETKEASISRKFGKLDESYDLGSNHTQMNQSRLLSEADGTDGMFSSLRFWFIILWALFGLVFVAVILMVFSGRRGKGKRGKSHRSKRRTSYLGFMDVNGRDRQTRSDEASL